MVDFGPSCTLHNKSAVVFPNFCCTEAQLKGGLPIPLAQIARLTISLDGENCIPPSPPHHKQSNNYRPLHMAVFWSLGSDSDTSEVNILQYFSAKLSLANLEFKHIIL